MVMIQVSLKSPETNLQAQGTGNALRAIFNAELRTVITIQRTLHRPPERLEPKEITVAREVGLNT